MNWNDNQFAKIEDLIFQYYHGDLDLSKLFKAIGKEEIQKIIDSI